jgi:hypothetical protein
MWLKHAAAVKLVPDAAVQLAPVAAALQLPAAVLQLLAPPDVQPAVAVLSLLQQQQLQLLLLSHQSKALRSQPRDSSRPLVLSDFDWTTSCDCFMKQACFGFRNKPVSL